MVRSFHVKHHLTLSCPLEEGGGGEGGSNHSDTQTALIDAMGIFYEGTCDTTHDFSWQGRFSTAIYILSDDVGYTTHGFSPPLLPLPPTRSRSRFAPSTPF